MLGGKRPLVSQYDRNRGIDYISRFQREMHWDSRGMHRSYSIKLYELETTQWHLAAFETGWAGPSGSGHGSTLDQLTYNFGDQDHVVSMLFWCWSVWPMPPRYHFFRVPKLLSCGAYPLEASCTDLGFFGFFGFFTEAHFYEFSKPKQTSGKSGIIWTNSWNDFLMFPQSQASFCDVLVLSRACPSALTSYFPPITGWNSVWCLKKCHYLPLSAMANIGFLCNATLWTQWCNVQICANRWFKFQTNTYTHTYQKKLWKLISSGSGTSALHWEHWTSLWHPFMRYYAIQTFGWGT